MYIRTHTHTHTHNHTHTHTHTQNTYTHTHTHTHRYVSKDWGFSSVGQLLPRLLRQNLLPQKSVHSDSIQEMFRDTDF
jgi:hypothetical protein